jgi:hypothetical protein
MQTTPGYKSTEFYLSLLAMLVGALLASGALPEHTIAFKIAGIGATVLAALGYTVSRTLVKNGAAAVAEAKADAAKELAALPPAPSPADALKDALR